MWAEPQTPDEHGKGHNQCGEGDTPDGREQGGQASRRSEGAKTRLEPSPRNREGRGPPDDTAPGQGTMEPELRCPHPPGSRRCPEQAVCADAGPRRGDGKTCGTKQTMAGTSYTRNDELPHTSPHWALTKPRSLPSPERDRPHATAAPPHAVLYAVSASPRGSARDNRREPGASDTSWRGLPGPPTSGHGVLLVAGGGLLNSKAAESSPHPSTDSRPVGVPGEPVSSSPSPRLKSVACGWTLQGPPYAPPPPAAGALALRGRARTRTGRQGRDAMKRVSFGKD